MAEAAALRQAGMPGENGVSAVQAPPGTLGARVRALRTAAGLSQTELAAGRVSKEYVSQVERGKTRPNTATLDWLAARLGTDREYLEHGVSAADALRAESLLDQAEKLSQQHRYDEAIAGFQQVAAIAGPTPSSTLALRPLLGEAWARSQQGRLDDALDLLEEARTLASTDVMRADILYRIGVCRYKQSQIPEALALFRRALQLTSSSHEPCAGLRSDIHHWRSRCFRRQREWDAAREDVGIALELAETLGDRSRTAAALFQASLIAEREGNWLLARQYGERAMELFQELGDEGNVGRLLNNLGGLNHLLGNDERAIQLLGEAFSRFVETGLAADAGHVLCSLAEIHLAAGSFDRAEVEARKALDLLGDREAYLHEIGTAQLALGRAQLEQGRLSEAELTMQAAEQSFERIGSVSHRANAWIAQGDLAIRRGDTPAAARQYRRAAAALHDAQL